jgi:hypothetical protein
MNEVDNRAAAARFIDRPAKRVARRGGVVNAYYYSSHVS